MTTPDRSDDDAALARIEALLEAEARATPPVAVSEAFMARMMSDARAALPPVATPRAPRATLLWARITAPLREALAQLGGTPALASLAVVGLAGVWIGAYPPEAVLVLEDAIFGTGLTLDFAALPLDFEE